MRWAAALSEDPDPDPGGAVREAYAQVLESLDGASLDLLLAFPSGTCALGFDEILDYLAGEAAGALLAGCSAHGVIGARRELEGQSALALTAAHLPDVRLAPFAIDGAEASGLGAIPDDVAGLVVLGDPFSADAESVARTLDEAFPGAVKIGGIASGGGRPGDHLLVAGPHRARSGCVGFALAGNVCVDPIVAQGCRPIGSPLFVTRAQDHVLLEVDGRPPLAVLQELFDHAPAAERELFQHSLFVGLEMHAERDVYEQGDFLVRNIGGSDPETGAIAVAGQLRPQQIVQFHLRDRATSAEDLERCLSRYASSGATPRGALLFSCVGRGVGLYGEPDHDSAAFARCVGDVPIGGFFGNGEIGPVATGGAPPGPETFLHSYTSAFAAFRPRFG